MLDLEVVIICRFEDERKEPWIHTRPPWLFAVRKMFLWFYSDSTSCCSVTSPCWALIRGSTVLLVLAEPSYGDLHAEPSSGDLQRYWPLLSPHPGVYSATSPCWALIRGSTVLLALADPSSRGLYCYLPLLSPHPGVYSATSPCWALIRGSTVLLALAEPSSGGLQCY